MFDVPEEKAIRQPIAMTTNPPTNSRRVVFGPRTGLGIIPDRSNTNSEPSVLSIATQLSIAG